MAYKTDGSSHNDGIKNEENLIQRLQSGAARQLYPDLSEDFQVIKRGGTKYKQDMEVVDGDTKILISAKKKTSISDGSFDWVNSSSATNKIDVLKEFANTVKSVAETQKTKSRARKLVSDAGNKALKGLCSSQLSDLLRENILDKNKDMKVIISETSTGNNWEYNFEDSPLANSIENHTPKIQMGRGKTSAKVVFEDSNGNIVDHGLRIRVVTNNGIGALIGQSKSNSCSIGVVKIQQDNIPGLISGLGTKIRKF